MRDIQPEPRKIATVSGIIFLTLFALTLVVIGKVSRASVVTGVLQAGTIFTLIGLFWEFYNRRAWKYRWLRFGGWLSEAPDLNGRWEGTVQRQNEDDPHPFVVEITQTYSSLSYRTFSRHSRGNSITTTIQNRGDEFFIVSAWQTTTMKRDGSQGEDMFLGCSSWIVSITEDEARIEDSYFTSREPSTKGRVIVSRVSKQRLNRFE